jgi:hypothetical protein
VFSLASAKPASGPPGLQTNGNPFFVTESWRTRHLPSTVAMLSCAASYSGKCSGSRLGIGLRIEP